MYATLINLVSALCRRGPPPALGERAAEIRGRMLRRGDPELAEMFSEFVTACIQARVLRRPSALQKVIRNFQRPVRKAPVSAKFRSKTGQRRAADPATTGSLLPGAQPGRASSRGRHRRRLSDATPRPLRGRAAEN